MKKNREELLSLKGIGPKRAENIIALRIDSSPPFKTVASKFRSFPLLVILIINCKSVFVFCCRYLIWKKSVYQPNRLKTYLLERQKKYLLEKNCLIFRQELLNVVFKSIQWINESMILISNPNFQKHTHTHTQ